MLIKTICFFIKLANRSEKSAARKVSVLYKATVAILSNNMNAIMRPVFTVSAYRRLIG